MDLVERIETTRFLGPEYLTWLWFKSELFEGDVQTLSEVSLAVWLDAQLLLQSVSDQQERTQLRGVAPSATQEAKLALLCGKVPLRARICLTYQEQDYTLVFDAPTFAMSTVKLPTVLTEAQGEEFFERMRLLEQLDDLFRELYQEFLSIRLTPLWQAEMLPALVAWANGKEQLTSRAYRGLLKRATKA